MNHGILILTKINPLQPNVAFLVFYLLPAGQPLLDQGFIHESVTGISKSVGDFGHCAPPVKMIYKILIYQFVKKYDDEMKMLFLFSLIVSRKYVWRRRFFIFSCVEISEYYLGYFFMHSCDEKNIILQKRLVDI